MPRKPKPPAYGAGFREIPFASIKDGDFVYLPEKLHFKASTLSGLGLHNGDTCRSPNRTRHVCAAFQAKTPGGKFIYVYQVYRDRAVKTSVNQIAPAPGKIYRIEFGVFPASVFTTPEIYLQDLTYACPGGYTEARSGKPFGIERLRSQAVSRLVGMIPAKAGFILPRTNIPGRNGNGDVFAAPVLPPEFADNFIAHALSSDDPALANAGDLRNLEKSLPVQSELYHSYVNGKTRRERAEMTVSGLVSESLLYGSVDVEFTSGPEFFDNLCRRGAVVLRSEKAESRLVLASAAPVTRRVASALPAAVSYLKSIAANVQAAVDRIERVQRAWNRADRATKLALDGLPEMMLGRKEETREQERGTV